jgi:hypothetical protein
MKKLECGGSERQSPDSGKQRRQARGADTVDASGLRKDERRVTHHKDMVQSPNFMQPT